MTYLYMSADFQIRISVICNLENLIIVDVNVEHRGLQAKKKNQRRKNYSIINLIIIMVKLLVFKVYNSICDVIFELCKENVVRKKINCEIFARRKLAIYLLTHQIEEI